MAEAMAAHASSMLTVGAPLPRRVHRTWCYGVRRARSLGAFVSCRRLPGVAGGGHALRMPATAGVCARSLVAIGHRRASVAAVLRSGLDRAGATSVGTLRKLRKLVWNVGLDFLQGVHLPILAM